MFLARLASAGSPKSAGRMLKQCASWLQTKQVLYENTRLRPSFLRRKVASCRERGSREIPHCVGFIELASNKVRNTAAGMTHEPDYGRPGRQALLQ